jgi:transposase
MLDPPPHYGLLQNAGAARLSPCFMIVWDDLVMAKGYRPVERDQVFLFPPSMRDWLPADHAVWLVIRAVEHLDTSAFHDRRRTGGAGAAGYDPDMLVMVLAWAYAHQVTSSRRIEQLCHTDVAFRVICGGNLPDHTTVARFRSGFAGPVAVFFAEVLGLCARLGMGKLGVVALDGTKIAANASMSANRAEDRLRKLAEETVAAHAAADAAEDELFGAGRRGDEVPADAWSPKSRDERIAAALRSLRAGREAAEAGQDAQASAYLDRVASGRPGRGSRPAAADVAAAQLRLEQATAAQQAKVDAWQQRHAGRPARGRAPVPPGEHVLVRRAAAGLARAQQRAAAAERRAAQKHKDRKGPGPVRNITDPDSRLMHVRGGGFIQGYNAQNVASQDGLIIATQLTADPADTGWLEPMLAAAQNAAALITASRASTSDSDSDSDGGQIGLLLADAGYLSEHNLTTPGPDRLIATGRSRELNKAAAGQSPGGGWHRTGPATVAMAARLATSDGIAAYRHRGHISETPHGDLKHNKRFRQLSVRGLPKASAEWQFATAVLNLCKAISTGHLTQAALDALTSQAT